MKEESISSEDLEKLAIFPLPDVVLFPHTVLPLHIFEPRYREMMVWLLERNAPLGVVLLKTGHEVDTSGRPGVYPVLGVGKLVHHQVLPDGRYDILLLGVARVHIEEEWLDPSLPFRTARCRQLPPGPENEVMEVMARMSILRGMLPGLGENHAQVAEIVGEVLTRSASPTAAGNLLATLTLRPSTLRQKLMEEDNLAQTLDEVIDALGDLMPENPDPEGLN